MGALIFSIMAKSDNFFGIRRGSTKSLTFSVFHGQQITKDRVVDVRNPQSAAQMEQRLKLTLVSNARSQLRDILDHSFEGIPYGENSLKYFSQQNLAKGKLNVASYVPKGISDCGLADYLVSRGSLSSIDYSVTASINFSFISEAFALPGLSIGAPLNSYPQILDFLSSLLNIDNNCQLTFLMCILGNHYQYSYNSLQKQDACYHKFLVSRLKFGKDSEEINKNWFISDFSYVSDDSSYVSLIVLSNGLISLSFNLPGPEDGFQENTLFIYSYVSEDDPSALNVLQSGAIIKSELIDGNWHRSTEKLKINPAFSFGVNFDDVLYSYMKKTSSSSKYLNSGVDGVDIAGGR